MKRLLSIFCFLISLSLFAQNANAQIAQASQSKMNSQNAQTDQASQTETSARSLVDEAVKKSSISETIDFLSKKIETLSNPADVRSLASFLASLHEQLFHFDEARKLYVKAAGIRAGDAQGFPKKSSESLVLDAVRCALSTGDASIANSYLNSAVRNSADETIQATIKLYEVWSRLCLAENENDLHEVIVLLDAYSSLPSMQSVKPSVLLTLWYLTSKKKYADALSHDFPNSLETGIVQGKVKMLPAPFWFFLPRK